MSTAAAPVPVSITEPIIGKVRGILALEGITGQAGEVVLHLTNQPGGSKLFRSATVAVDGAYSVSVSTEDTFFLSIRPDGAVLVHVGPNTGTSARFTVTRVDGFEYHLSAKETRYTFVERKAGGEARLHVTIVWS